MSRYSDAMRESLVGRIRRLRRLIDLDAPDPVLAMGVVLVYEAAIGALGSEMDAEIGRVFRTRQRIMNGFCPTADCDGLPVEADGPSLGNMCQDCLDSVEADEEAADEQNKLDTKNEP